MIKCKLTNLIDFGIVELCDVVDVKSGLIEIRLGSRGEVEEVKNIDNDRLEFVKSNYDVIDVGKGFTVLNFVEDDERDEEEFFIVDIIC